MMLGKTQTELRSFLDSLESQGLKKQERILTTPQRGRIGVEGRGEVLNFCANNYLGLSDSPDIIEAAKAALDRWGYGLSSVRFICGTQSIHKELEDKISAFLGTEDTILFSSCFDANGAVFEPLMEAGDTIISDELNHASIIDGIRLSKAERLRYKHSDMVSLEAALKSSSSSRRRLIATDGVFSMDGDIALLKDICALAEKYDAMVMVDDSHATGYIGPTGRGTPEYWGVTDRVDIVTTTFGKACGGASGGCISGRRELVGLFRQRARPYLFSNTLAPVICGATLKVIELLEAGNPYRGKTLENAARFRDGMEKAGFELVKGNTAIVPVMTHDEVLAVDMASRLLDEGVYVIGFTYPVVPRGKARIRVQLSAQHTSQDIDTAIAAFVKVGRQTGLIS